MIFRSKWIGGAWIPDFQSYGVSVDIIRSGLHGDDCYNDYKSDAIQESAKYWKEISVHNQTNTEQDLEWVHAGSHVR